MYDVGTLPGFCTPAVLYANQALVVVDVLGMLLPFEYEPRLKFATSKNVFGVNADGEIA